MIDWAAKSIEPGEVVDVWLCRWHCMCCCNVPRLHAKLHTYDNDDHHFDFRISSSATSFRHITHEIDHILFGSPSSYDFSLSLAPFFISFSLFIVVPYRGECIMKQHDNYNDYGQASFIQPSIYTIPFRDRKLSRRCSDVHALLSLGFLNGNKLA